MIRIQKESLISSYLFVLRIVEAIFYEGLLLVTITIKQYAN